MFPSANMSRRREASIANFMQNTTAATRRRLTETCLEKYLPTFLIFQTENFLKSPPYATYTPPDVRKYLLSEN
jgi:hypothetical protein